MTLENKLHEDITCSFCGLHPEMVCDCVTWQRYMMCDRLIAHSKTDLNIYVCQQMSPRKWPLSSIFQKKIFFTHSVSKNNNFIFQLEFSLFFTCVFKAIFSSFRIFSLLPGVWWTTMALQFHAPSQEPAGRTYAKLECAFDLWIIGLINMKTEEQICSLQSHHVTSKWPVGLYSRSRLWKVHFYQTKGGHEMLFHISPHIIIIPV